MKNEILEQKKNKATEIVSLLDGLDDADISSIYLVAQALYIKKELSQKKQEAELTVTKQ